MHKKTTRLATFFMILCCIIISGCAQKNTMVIMEKGAKASLHTPSNLTVKVIGNTVYTYKDTTIPVGEIMKDSLEENLRKNKKFSLDKNLNSQYLIGVNIIKYEPRIDPEKKKLQLFQYPVLWYDVLVCDIKTDKKGEKIIGNKLFSIPFDKGGEERSGGISMSNIPMDYTSAAVAAVDIVHGALTHKTAWRDAIEDAAKKISQTLDDVFSK